MSEYRGLDTGMRGIKGSCNRTVLIRSVFVGIFLVSLRLERYLPVRLSFLGRYNMFTKPFRYLKISKHQHPTNCSSKSAFIFHPKFPDLCSQFLND